MKKALFWVGGLFILGSMAFGILKKEELLASGRTVLLRLAPRDPRSLMQGDYMDLRYEIARKLPKKIPRVGKIVLRLDGNQVGHFVSLYEQKPLGPNQVLLRYRRRGNSIHLGAESFFFEEGQADRFSSAAYGELRVSPSGESLLVGLRDDHLKKL
ncbi:MAG TPA: hypothetical protein ENK02_06525 [Planctomycetes bacterium]|nr:hypothetical protein [Planctomycetota bacterium]